MNRGSVMDFVDVGKHVIYVLCLLIYFVGWGRDDVGERT